MRELKYIKLFEAFESSILSNTLSFIKDDQQKRDLKYKLESILASIKNESGEKVSAPMSLLKDEFFQYLPYKKAVSLKVGDVPLECPRCEGKGTVKKAYARGTRNVKCDRCDGTGNIDPKPTLKYFKFWLNSEGNYVATTAVDGIYHPDKEYLSGYDFTDITEDAKTLSASEMKAKYGIVNGETQIYMDNMKLRTYRDDRTSIICTAFIDSAGHLFAINKKAGHYFRPTGRKWKEYGNESIRIKDTVIGGLSGEKDARAFIIKPKNIKEDIFWNTPVVFRTRWDFSIGNPMPAGFLKDAHAAIVFDFEKFREWFLASGEKSVTQIKGEREEAKKGSAALMTDEYIRSANIERYLKQMAEIDVAEGLTSIVRKLPRIFGGKNCIFYIYSSKNLNELSNLIGLIYDFMETEDADERKEINRSISRKVRNIYDENKVIDDRIESRLNIAVEEIAKLDESEAASLRELFSAIMELSKFINEELLRTSLLSIEDMDALKIKIKGIGELLGNSRLDAGFRYFLSESIARYIDPRSMFERLKQMNKEKALSEIERVKRIIKSLSN